MTVFLTHAASAERAGGAHHKWQSLYNACTCANCQDTEFSSMATYGIKIVTPCYNGSTISLELVSLDTKESPGSSANFTTLIMSLTAILQWHVNPARTTANCKRAMHTSGISPQHKTRH